MTDDFTGDAETLTNIVMHVDDRAGMRKGPNMHDQRYHARLQALEAMGEFDELCELEVQRAALMLESTARYESQQDRVQSGDAQRRAHVGEEELTGRATTRKTNEGRGGTAKEPPLNPARDNQREQNGEAERRSTSLRWTRLWRSSQPRPYAR